MAQAFDNLINHSAYSGADQRNHSLDSSPAVYFLVVYLPGTELILCHANPQCQTSYPPNGQNYPWMHKVAYHVQSVVILELCCFLIVILLLLRKNSSFFEDCHS